MLVIITDPPIRLRVWGTESKGAFIDGHYRYSLWRRWDFEAPQPAFFTEPFAWGPPLVVDMINPSVADDEESDNTIDRLGNYACALGAGGLIVVNLHALRATDPKDLTTAFAAGAPIVGPRNLEAVELAFTLALTRGYVVAAWGAIPAPQKRDRIAEHVEIARRLGVEFRCLLKDANGNPCHPLVRQKVHPEPVPWSPR